MFHVAPSAAPALRRDPADTARRLILLLAVVAVLVVLSFLFLWPVVMLALGVFRSAPPGLPGEWTLQAFEVFLRSSMYEALFNSLILAASTTAIGVFVAALLAYVNVRTNTPLRGLITPAIMLLLAVPNTFYALGWAMLGNPRSGLVNVFGRSIFGEDVTLFNSTSWVGLITVLSIKACAFSYLLILGAFKLQSSDSLDAANIAGSGRWGTLFRVDLPSLAPAIGGAVIICMILALEAFETPLFLGVPAGIRVFATDIYSTLRNTTPPEYGEASLLSIVLFVVVILLAWWYRSLMSKREYSTVGGRNYRTAQIDLGAVKYVVSALVVLFLLIAVVLPVGQTLAGSFQTYLGNYASFTLDNYAYVLGMRDLPRAAITTIAIFALGGVVIAVALALNYFAIRMPRHPATRYAWFLTWFPLALPGVVLGIAIMWGVMSVPGINQLGGTIWLMLIGVGVAGIPLASRVAEGAVRQVRPDIEDAALIGGASRGRMLSGIVAPLIATSFFSGWVLVGLSMIGNLAVPLMLSATSWQPVAVMSYDLYNFGRIPQAGALFGLTVLGALIIAVAVFVVILGTRLIQKLIARRTDAAA
ncbi:MAG: iron ABC transporter permease [Microbacterium sp.]|nr:MAG: iron ABC transporter permease [Microbacterium sp.]